MEWAQSSQLIEEQKKLAFWTSQNPTLFELSKARLEQWKAERELLTFVWRAGKNPLKLALMPMPLGHFVTPTMGLICDLFGLSPSEHESFVEIPLARPLPEVLHLQIYPARRREQARILQTLRGHTCRIKVDAELALE